MYCAALNRNYKAILDLSSGENEFPVAPVKYHIAQVGKILSTRRVSYRVLTEKFSSGGTAKGQPAPRRSARDPTQASSSAVLPVLCSFCSKAKYKSGTRARDAFRRAEEFVEDATTTATTTLFISTIFTTVTTGKVLTYI